MSVVVSTNQPRTVIGPLTTTFTPPADCTNAVVGCAESCTVAWQAQGCADSNAVDTTDCWPSASADAPSPTAPFAGWGFYSPGLHCPVGHTTACSATGGKPSGWPFEYELVTGETAMGCCPTGFTCAYAFGQTCESVANNYATVAVATCSGSKSVHVSELTVPYTISVSGSASSASNSYAGMTVAAYEVYAPMIDIRWQSGDLPATSSSGTTGSAAAVTSTSTSSTGAASKGSGGLSTGAEAGIGIGIAIVVLAVLLLGGYFIWRKRRRAHRTGQQQQQHQQYRDGASPRAELPETPIYEMEDPNRPSEIGDRPFARHERYEVKGSDPEIAQLPS